jgi:hypothetical protein
MRCKFIAFSAALFAGITLHAQEAPAPVDIPVDIGQSVKDIRVPHHNAQGKLSLRLNAGQAERSSNTAFTFTDLEIEIFGEQTEAPSLTVILPEAVFDQTTRRLSSDRRSVIKGDTIEITGRDLEFDIDSRTSHLTGPVTMVVTSANAIKP